MILPFYKYQGTGNDFVLIDNRQDKFPKNNTNLVSHICDRRFGIGADGLILLENDTSADFGMTYYNSDGKPGSMCGNGGRCIVAFAKFLGLIDSESTFMAVDGLHYAHISPDDIIRLQMKNVSEIHEKPPAVLMDTGSPHHVQMVSGLKDFDVAREGAKLRYGLYGKNGRNINFVEALSDNLFSVRTYERGVEDETLSCGTGVTAVALAMHYKGKTKEREIRIKARGGALTITFEPCKKGYENIFLSGPAVQVFKGEFQC